MFSDPSSKLSTYYPQLLRGLLEVAICFDFVLLIPQRLRDKESSIRQVIVENFVNPFLLAHRGDAMVSQVVGMVDRSNSHSHASYGGGANHGSRHRRPSGYHSVFFLCSSDFSHTSKQ